MKFTMSPSRAYLLAVWKSRRGKEGVGIEGNGPICELFLKACLDEKLCQPHKVKFEEDAEGAKVYFYNSAVRSWLQEEMGRREGRLRHKNEFAASYFAGLFDAKGGFVDVKGKKLCYFFGDRSDEMVLLRLGFRVKKERGKLAVLSEDFYGWIMPYLKLERSKLF